MRIASILLAAFLLLGLATCPEHRMHAVAGAAADGSLSPENRYSDCVRRCLDRLLASGTDRYGSVKTPMMMSIIDVRTSEAPREPLLLDGWARSQERPGRRNPGGCDLWDDQPLLQALYRSSTASGDPRYAQAADDYVHAFFTRAKKANGLLAWGSHLFYDAYTDRIDNDRHGEYHEILIHLAQWDELWRVEPEGVRSEIEGIWKWHIVDKATGQHNRHDDGKADCDFSFSGGSFAHAFAFLYKKTGDRIWLDRARLVVNWHWSHRNPKTNLVPDAPSTGERYDAKHCFTVDVGPHALALLRCFEITREPFFRDAAAAYIKAWLKYAWDEKAGLFFAALELDGTPVPEKSKAGNPAPPATAAYDAWMPTGYADTWPSDMFSYDQPLAAAQACIYAFELTQDREMLDGAQKWARHIRSSLPASVGRRWRKEIHAAMPEAARTGGAYADGYGRAISFFVHLHRATKDKKDLETATALADEAMDKLGENGWLKGHSAKPYYETTDGVGALLVALLELAE